MAHGLRRTAFDQSSYAYWTGQYGVVNVKDFDDTATAQTITYPTAFVQVPNVTNPGAVPGVSTTATTLSIDPDTTDAYTGWIVVEGY